MINVIKRIFFGICIVSGAAFIAVPFYYHFNGQNETDKLMDQFNQSVICNTDEDGNTAGDTDEGENNNGDSKTRSLFRKADVIGIIEIKKVNIRYPILEGAGELQMKYAIGHIPETAGPGENGNCVLCGHNGSRYGSFFTNLNRLSLGDVVKITDKKGKVHMYEATKCYITGPYNNMVKNQSDEELLTLLTCADKGARRFVCRCIPVKE